MANFESDSLFDGFLIIALPFSKFNWPTILAMLKICIIDQLRKTLSPGKILMIKVTFSNDPDEPNNLTVLFPGSLGRLLAGYDISSLHFPISIRL
jgi:hypothetical protein